MKQTFGRSNYLLINNLFIPSTIQFLLYVATVILVVANVLSHEVTTIAIWHHISTYPYYYLMRHSSHCRFFVSRRSSTTCVCRDATALFLLFTSAMVNQVASSYDCVVATISSGKLFGLEVIIIWGVISVALAMNLHRQSACRDAKRLLTTLAWEVACRQKSTARHRPGWLAATTQAARRRVWAGRVGGMHHYWLVKESFGLFSAIL